MSYNVVPESMFAERTVNVIRRVVDNIVMPENVKDKKLIPLSIGDPTNFGNLKTPSVFMKAIQNALMDYRNHGYQHSAGMPVARKAVANRHSRSSGRQVDSNNVIIASGCSGALEIAIKGIANEGDNILMPRPGFPLYETIMRANNIGVRFYPLIPEKQWEADVRKLEAAIDEKTKAIIINNPSNPCGSVYTKEHLLELLQVAEKHKLVVIADEIYGNIVFNGETFYPVASLTQTVPVLEVGGIAKEFLVPGFRIGWLIIHDVPAIDEGETVLQNAHKGMIKLSQIILGGNTLIQAALPSILDPRPGTDEKMELAQFLKDTNTQLESNAKFLQTRLNAIHGLTVIPPQGAMYVMVGISKDILGMDDIEFSQELLREQHVFVLPGSCFGMEYFVRVVICAPHDILGEACTRIKSFCDGRTNSA